MLNRIPACCSQLAATPATTIKPPTLLWIGCGSCSGESMAMLGVDGQATDFLICLSTTGYGCCGIPRSRWTRWHQLFTRSWTECCR